MPRRQRRSKRRLPVTDGWQLWVSGEPIPDDTPENQTARDEWIDWQYFADAKEITDQIARTGYDGPPPLRLLMLTK